MYQALEGPTVEEQSFSQNNFNNCFRLTSNKERYLVLPWFVPDAIVHRSAVSVFSAVNVLVRAKTRNGWQGGRAAFFGRRWRSLPLISRRYLPFSPVSDMISFLLNCVFLVWLLVKVVQLLPFCHSASQGGLQLCCFSLLPRCGKISLAWMLCCVFHSMAVKQNVAALFHWQTGLAFFF